MNDQNLPIGIIGGGLAGLSLACLLGKAGFDVVCVDAQPLEKQLSSAFDGRTTAISYASAKVLERAGVWTDMLSRAQGIRVIDILDGNSPHVLQFDSADMNTDAFGWIVDNADLRRALIAQVQSLKSVTHLTGVSVDDVKFYDDHACIFLSDGQDLNVALAIGADGRKSVLRRKMRIGTYGRDYDQSAIVCLVTHALPHDGTAVEHFMTDGPFAMLPYTDTDDGKHRSAVVWSVKGRDAKGWVNAPLEVFNAALLERSKGRFGDIEVAGRREFWPLTLVKAYSYVGTRSLLMAEAAHGIHPIAGQGLNMSLRDLGALSDILMRADDVGAPETLKEFERARRADNVSMMFATDILTLLFSNEIPPVRMARAVGLHMVSKLPVVKKFFMAQAMGLGLSKGQDIGDTLRRYLPSRQRST